MSHVRMRRVARVGFAAGLALIGLLAALGISDAREARDAAASVERSHDAIEALDEISARLGEAKSARRAYGLTGDPSYRDIYQHAVHALPERVATVGTLTADSDVQRASLAELQPVLAARLERLEAQAAAREATGKEALPDDARAVENGKLDDAIRRIVTGMVDEEHHRLVARETASRDRLERGELIVGISAISACVLLLIAFGLISREVRQRQRAESATQVALLATKSLNAELEAFSYSVSHDLRAPLRAIDGFSQALLEDNAQQLDEDGKRHLERVRAASQRMAQLIDDLLGLSRVTRSLLRLEAVDLSALATTVADELRDAHRERDIAVTIEPALSAVGDPRLLRIVFDNLLGNAFKFTAKKPRAQIHVGLARDGGEPAYFVRDDGAGFDAKHADKMFGAFQRLHDARDFAGTGIGLATAQRIVARHGGRIWATSELGLGATFFFTLGVSETEVT